MIYDKNNITPENEHSHAHGLRFIREAIIEEVELQINAPTPLVKTFNDARLAKEYKAGVNAFRVGLRLDRQGYEEKKAKGLIK